MKLRLFDRIPPLICTALLLGSVGALAGCDTAFEGTLPRRDQINYPVGLTFHPNGKYFYVVNSNFDAKFRPDAGGTISVIDADTLQIRAERTPFAPSFGANIALNFDASRAYVTARAGNSVVAYDVSDDGGALFCTDARGVATSDPADCVISRVPDTSKGARVPADPFGLAVFSVERPDVGLVDVLNLAHLTGTQVSTITLPERALSAATMRTAPLLRGATAIAQRPGTLDLYVAGRRTNTMAIFQPYINDRGEVEAIVQRGSFVLNHRAEMVDARGVVFEPDGSRLYVLTRAPRALHIIDIVPADPTTGGGSEHRIVDSIPLRTQPGSIALHTTPQGQRLAYITSYAEQLIQVVDLEARAILTEIELDSNPYDIVIEPRTSGCYSAEARCRAFVTLFNDTPRTADSCAQTHGGCGSVAVIDINPLHRDTAHPQLSRYHTILQKIR